ncbi:MAG TPA: cell envelope integrity protein TolA [Ferruginibacter sp.]|nr:cell envelope integrity protein TolA [Ferruginibacter sp.]
MSATFETEKNRKAFIYTAIICGALLLLAFLISWTHQHTPPPALQDLIEINLGNNSEGYGEVQPLVKGEKSPVEENAEQPKSEAVKTPEAEDVKTDDLADKESAPVKAPAKTTVKVKTPTPEVVKPEPKPQKPKLTGYGGPKTGTGNGATEDNYKMGQGNNPNGKGDAGSPNGKPDSYGKDPGGRSGGLIIKGDRKIINHYYFQGDLPKATVNAVIKISPEGKGTFVRIDPRGSTTTDSRYANDIRNKLPNIQFSIADHESTVTITFNFTVGN